MNTNSLIVFLPFGSSPTLDLCGNSWTAYNNPTISNGALKTNGTNQYLELTNFTPPSELFNSDFTIHFYMNYRDSKTYEGGFFGFYPDAFSWQCYGSKARFSAHYNNNGNTNAWYALDSANLSEFKNAEHHFAMVRKDNTLYFFLDGTLKKSYTVGTFTDTATTLHIARRSNYRTALDMRDFCIHTEALWTENFTPPTDDELFAAEIELAGYAERSIDADIQTAISNPPVLNSATKVWLTADNFPTEDIAGNLWHAYNNPTTSNGALQLSGANQWLAMDGGITLGGKDFTIRGKFNMSSATGSYATLFTLSRAMETNQNLFCLRRTATRAQLQFICMNATSVDINVTLDTDHDFEVAYTQADTTFRFFIDGQRVFYWAREIPQTVFKNVWLGRPNYYANGYFAGTIDEFQIIDGIALHTANFTPMTVAEIDALKADFNARYSIGFSVQNQIDNAPLTWRYENAGFASLVLPNATTLNNLPATQSKTSVAFYQTAQSKSFDIPAAKDIWMKFDVYFDGTNRWRAYNGGSNGITGVTAQTTPALTYFSNGVYVPPNIAGTVVKNQLQTFLLHMHSHSSAGIVEAWLDGNLIHSYTGDVNHGENFSDIYLQSDGGGTFFSNVIVSNGEISFSEDVPHDVFNVEKIYDVEYVARNYDENFCIAYPGGRGFGSALPVDKGIGNSSPQFTIEVKVSTTHIASTSSNSPSYNATCILGKDNVGSTSYGVQLRARNGYFLFYQSDANTGSDVDKTIITNKFISDNVAHKISVRSNSDGSLDIFIDGELISHTDNYNAFLEFAKPWGQNASFANSANGGQSSSGFPMLIFEARIWGTALADDEIFSDIDGTEENLRAWYLPTPNGLMDFSTNMFHPTNQGNYFGKYFAVPNDMEIKIQNDALIWRYDDSVIYKGTGLPIKFHLPATYELWARFDVTFDGVNHWYAFCGEVDDMTGAGAANDTDLDYFADNVSVQSLLNVLTKHRAQSFLLHMVSGIDDGKIELWIKNVKQEIFTGNVNGGEPFTDFNLLCSGGTFFSNIIVSNVSLEPSEVVRNSTQFTAYNSATHAFYLGKGGTYPNSITYSIQNVVNHITEIDVTNINEIWAKFDATSDGVNRWWFYNDDGFGKNGIAALLDGSADFIADDETVQTQTDAITLNQTQSYIVHMISDAENGLIELRVKNGGTYTYTGNVNDGEAFDEIWLRSESRQVVFGNYILSTSPLNFDADVKVDVDGEPLTKIFFNVRHNGDVIKIPFVAAQSSNAVAIRWLKQNWYNPLASSGDISLRLGNVTQALASEL